MKYFLTFLLAISCLVATLAAEKSGEDRGRERSRGGRGMGRRGGNFMEQFKSKYPKEYAEMEKLRESDPEKAREKMRDLMRKAMADRGMMPRGPRNIEPTEEQLKELKAKYPAEFAEYEKLHESDPEKAKAKLQDLMKKTFGEAVGNEKFLRDSSRRATSHVMRELKERYPEKMAEIEKLQKTDPDTAREELRKLFSEAKIRMPRGHRELNYEYIPPQQMQNFRNGMMNRNYPYGGGRFGGMGGNMWNRSGGRAR